MKLKIGHYCKPRNEEERDAVISIARSIGLGVNAGLGYVEFPYVYLAGERLISELAKYPFVSSSSYRELPVPDFISAMYETAGKPQELCTNIQTQLDAVHSKELYDDVVKRLDALERFVNEKSATLQAVSGDMTRLEIGLAKSNNRIFGLEKVVNDRMMEERERYKPKVGQEVCFPDHSLGTIYDVWVRDDGGFNVYVDLSK
jgi:hypothetical protein